MKKALESFAIWLAHRRFIWHDLSIFVQPNETALVTYIIFLPQIFI